MNREIRSLAVLAEAQGWLVEYGGKHLRWLSPDEKLVTTPITPGGGNRSVQNTLADLRRAGLEIPRKAPRRKEQPENAMAQALVEAAKDLDIDITVGTWPFVTVTIGQWRDLSWFTEEGLPLTEAQWQGPTVESSIRAILVTTLNDIDFVGGALVVLPKDNPLAPSDLQKRIWVDAYRYWASLSDPPQACSCGFAPSISRSKYGNLFSIAEHIYRKHERGDVSHEPVGLLPWMDPQDLFDLADSDQTERVLRLEGDLAECRAEREKWKARATSITNRLSQILMEK